MSKVDVWFRLLGNEIPADHGYHLFSAISRLLPALHDDKEVGVHPVSGRLVGNRRMALTAQSALTIRLDADRIGDVLPLAGKTLSLGDTAVRVGVPQTRALAPASRLYSRLVVIKGFMEPDAFLEAVQRQLDEMQVRAKASLVEQPEVPLANRDRPTGTRSPYLHRTLRIRDKEVMGFAVRVEELIADESIRLQERGLGGRRRFGCGVFVPDRFGAPGRQGYRTSLGKLGYTGECSFG